MTMGATTEPVDDSAAIASVHAQRSSASKMR